VFVVGVKLAGALGVSSENSAAIVLYRTMKKDYLKGIK